jgi:hypothetical protein
VNYTTLDNAKNNSISVERLFSQFPCHRVWQIDKHHYQNIFTLHQSKQSLDFSIQLSVHLTDFHHCHHRSPVLANPLEHEALALPLLLLPLLLSIIVMHNNLLIFQMKWAAHGFKEEELDNYIHSAIPPRASTDMIGDWTVSSFALVRFKIIQWLLSSYRIMDTSIIAFSLTLAQAHTGQSKLLT